MAPNSRIRAIEVPTPDPPSSEDSEHETEPQNNDDYAEDSSSEFDENQYELKPIVADPSKKRSVEPMAVSPKRSKMTRAWTEDDDIALLSAMVELKNQKGSIPKNAGEVADFMEGKLLGGASFSAEQIGAEMGRLEFRFSDAVENRTDGKKDPVFPNPHELKAYEISMKIWGDELGKAEAKDSEEDDDGEDGCNEVRDFWSKYPHLRASFESLNVGTVLSGHGISLVKEKLELIGDEKAEELNQKWKELLIEEIEIHSKKMGLMMYQVKLAVPH